MKCFERLLGQKNSGNKNHFLRKKRTAILLTMVLAGCADPYNAEVEDSDKVDPNKIQMVVGDAETVDSGETLLMVQSCREIQSTVTDAQIIKCAGRTALVPIPDKDSYKFVSEQEVIPCEIAADPKKLVPPEFAGTCKSN